MRHPCIAAAGAFLLAAVSTCTAAEPLPAFPGAEGFGAASLGGRGGRVIRVTNLNAKGPGSLQAACEAEGPRIVVFAVSGVIQGAVQIKHPRITLAGQTAPGAGITIEGMLKNPYRIQPNLTDVTIRFLRVRPPVHGGKWQGGDCLQLTDVDRLIVDHVSCSWGSDENIDVCNSRRVTIQWCSNEESDTKGHSEGRHNFGMICGYAGKDLTLHHNLFAHHSKRAPLCGLETLDHRNNVIYNMLLPLIWHPLRMNRQRPDEPFKANVVGNYFKAGPDVAAHMKGRPFDRLFWKRPNVHLYDTGNYLAWMEKIVQSEGKPAAEAPWPVPAVGTQTASEAYARVLAVAGCLPRDAVSRRTVEEVKTATGQWGRREPEGGLMAGLKPAKAPADNDRDGMPDAWETAHGLDPKDPADAGKAVPPGASKNDRHVGYTYIEFYVNELADKLVADAAALATKAK